MRELILHTAAELFVENGFEKTSIRTIAEKIEYSPATIYLYFKDKDELFYAISEQAFGLSYQYFSAIPDIEDPMEKLHALGQAYFKFAFENPGYYDLMFILRAPMKADQTEEKWVSGAASHQVLFDIVDDCIAAGHFKGKDPKVVSFWIWATVHGIVSLKIRDRLKLYPEESWDKLVYEALELFNQVLRES